MTLGAGRGNLAGPFAFLWVMRYPRANVNACEGMNMDEAIEFCDLGDAKVETKQTSPIPPFYFDNQFGRGSTPAWGGPGTKDDYEGI